ncbi:unnamed protein product [Linum tenue]|uniref:Peptidase A1 domain-containing protein n=1 Tax=Linum tenue TaxID=586396 RepID=A0AAV0JNH2_9ROSI|nr:unnamed protein product [Linum tenue]
MASHFTFLLLLLPFLSSLSSATTTITLDLIHRDSPLSPLYNPNHTASDRLHAAFLRSISRRNHRLCRHTPRTTTNSDSSHFHTNILPSGGEYFMNLSIGTPPFTVLAIADTGSDLTWVQSKPCYQCYHQKGPIFDPAQSSTFHRIQCGAQLCNSLDDDSRSCSQDGTNTCAYAYSYGDHSYTTGYLATDTFSLGPTSISHVGFGCGMRNGGTFDESGSGIVGLGGGPISFVNQLGAQIGGKFSYCLVPLQEQSGAVSATSRIVFGDDPLLLSSNDVGLVSTPLASKSPATYYYLTLEAITVGRRKMRYATTSYVTSGGSRFNDGADVAGREKKVEEGNIIIDSGTTLTFLDSEFYSGLEAALVEEIQLERASDPKNLFSLCFKSGGEGKEVRLPVLKVHFGGGADVELKPVNTFVKAEEGLLCFTMVPTKDVGIFGNLAQMDFVVGYDLEKRTVSFLPADCSKH